MIIGILIDVSSKELREHITKRAKDHTDKVNLYTKQVEALSDAAATIDKSTSIDPIRDLKYKIEEHQDKAAFFLFMADHLVVNETYRLSESDLARLEIAARYF